MEALKDEKQMYIYLKFCARLEVGGLKDESLASSDEEIMKAINHSKKKKNVFSRPS